MRTINKPVMPRLGYFLADCINSYDLVRKCPFMAGWFDDITIAEAEFSLDRREVIESLIFCNIEHYINTLGWFDGPINNPEPPWGELGGLVFKLDYGNTLRGSLRRLKRMKYTIEVTQIVEVEAANSEQANEKAINIALGQVGEFKAQIVEVTY
jgi:hypothetical protein